MIRKWGLDKEEVRYRIALILSFVLPVVIMLSIFIVRGIFPFGGRSFLCSDMFHQYMPFFEEFMDKIKGGDGLFYSYHVGIGTNFLALYVYYLASPLHWLAFLIPQTYLMEFMSYLVIVKMGLCGFTFFLYLKERFECKDCNMLFFACFYALSGYMAAYNWNIMWLDCVLLLPLIVLGLERLVKEGRWKLYCVTLALSILTNYYISIMICIFLVLYFVGLLITEKRSLKILLQFALSSLLAAGMAAVLLVPEACAILETEFGDPDFPKKLESYFSVLDMGARHCLAVTTEKGLEHWPNIYCGVAVFLLLPLYALNEKISIRKRFVNLALAGIFLLSFATNGLDFVWHGMNYPDSLPARQSFIYIFLILVMCFEAYRNIKETEPKQILYGYLAAVVFLLWCEKFVESDDFGTGVEILSLIFVTIYSVILYLYRIGESQRRKTVLLLITLVVVVTESTLNMVNTSVSTIDRNSYLEPLEDYQALYDWVREGDDSFYRMEKFTRKTKNDGALAGYPTASVFSSTLNSRVMDMYERLGMRHSKVYYGFDGATAFTSALLNVNYMFGEHERYGSPLYELVEQSNGVYLYESQARLPFGYVAPLGFDLPETGEFEGNGLALQNILVKKLEVAGSLFLKVVSEQVGDDVVFTAEEPGIYYGVLTASGTKKVDLVGGSLETHTFPDLKKGAVLYLGYLEAGESMTLTNGDDEDTSPKIIGEIYRMDRSVLDAALERLSQNSLQNVTYDSTHIRGEITMKEEGRLILSVPYEDGWHIRVNGEERKVESFGGSLMAFDLEPGEYVIEMHYIPEGFYWGVGISLVSVVLFVLLNRRKKEKRVVSIF